MTDAVQRLGKYAIIEEVGKGGFATVYRARDLDLGREVALKVLDPLLTRDPVWVARFRREARAVATLDHPRIITVYEIGQAEGALFIAMRLVEGGSLRQRIEAQGALPWDEAVRVVSQIAEGLDFAHGVGVLHRDLKPANVLLDSRTGAVLTDFGFARLVADNSLSVSMSGGIVGTPATMAPEVWEGQEPTAQADVYALGCILYELVIGQPLFSGATPPAVMLAHFKPLTLPAQWPQGTPPGLGEVLQTALARDPAARYARAGDLAAALAALSVDRLAEPYAALQAAVAGQQWQQALHLAAEIKGSQPDYRDVAALERQALAGLEGAARAQSAAQWRATAEEALAAGDLAAAQLALKQWQAVVPEDPALVNAQARLLATPPPAGGTPPAPARPRRSKADALVATGALAMVAILLAAVLWPRNETGGSLPVPSVPSAIVVAATATATQLVRLAPPTDTLVAAQTVAVAEPITPTVSVAMATPTVTLSVLPTRSPTATSAPTHTPTATATRTSTPMPQPDAVVNTQNANLRAGPGTNYDQLGSYAAGTALAVTGKTAAGDWLQVQAPDGRTGWMAGSLLHVNTDLGPVAVVAAPPTPTSSAIAGMVYVPAGDFLMGSTDADTEADGDEKPQHTVYLDAFWIDQTEVTVAQYQGCLEAGLCSAPSTGGTCTYGADGKSDHPINCVDWSQAAVYCGWAGRRLPTEAEWEKAARGADGRIFPWGDQAPDAKLANFAGNVGRTTAVGSCPAGVSPYGALDMAGNVWEWAADWYDETTYTTSPRENPQGPASDQYRVLRGGSWYGTAFDVRAAFRDRLTPGSRVVDIGFRCARSP